MKSLRAVTNAHPTQPKVKNKQTNAKKYTPKKYPIVDSYLEYIKYIKSP